MNTSPSNPDAARVKYVLLALACPALAATSFAFLLLRLPLPLLPLTFGVALLLRLARVVPDRPEPPHGFMAMIPICVAIAVVYAIRFFA